MKYQDSCQGDIAANASYELSKFIHPSIHYGEPRVHQFTTVHPSLSKYLTFPSAGIYLPIYTNYARLCNEHEH